MTTDHQPVAEVSHGRLRWHLPTPDADPAGRFIDNDTHLLYDQAALDAAVAAERERWFSIAKSHMDMAVALGANEKARTAASILNEGLA